MVLLVVAIVVQLVLAVLLSSFSSSYAYWIINGTYSLCLLLSGYIYCRCNSIDMLSGVKMNSKPRLIDSLWLCVVVFLLVNGATPINDFFVSVIEGLGGNVGGIDSALVYDNVVLAVLVVCIIAPVVEELLFRGIIGSGLLSGGRVVLAIVLGGLIFALFHMSMAQLLHQFITGCVLMIFVWRSGSIWVAIVGHVFNNVLVLVLDYYVYSTGWYTDNAVWVAIVGMLLAGVAVIGYLLYTRNRVASSVQKGSDAVGIAVTDRAILLLAMSLSLLMLVVGVL